MFVYNEPANPVGLCRYHDWVMSAKQIKTKKCLHKENNGNWCTHFVAFDGDAFWKTRRVRGKSKTKRR